MSGNRHGKTGLEFAVLCAASSLWSCAQILGLSGDYEERPDDASQDDDASTLPFRMPAGKLVYHRFTNYYAGDSRMFVVDVPSGERSAEIGETYGLCHPLNGIFSLDGKRMVVMAMPRGEGACGETDRYLMDVYELDLESPGQKIRVTDNDVPDEDPQFFADGSRLLFKHDGHIAEWPEGAGTFTDCDALPEGARCYAASGEQSKPVVTPDATTICYYEGQQSTADIYCFARADAENGTPLENVRYPGAVHRDILDARPAITAGSLYYVRWRSIANQTGYIARKALNDLSGVGEDASFARDEAADYNDPFGIGDDLVLFSSNQAGQGGYDLFVARFDDTVPTPLDVFFPGFNSNLQDLGVAFWRAPD